MKKAYPFILPAFRSVLFIFAGLLFSSISGQTLLESSRWWSLICTACNVLTIGVLVIVFRSEGKTYKDIIGFEKGRIKVGNTASMTILMFILGIGGMAAAGYIIYGNMPTGLINPIPPWIAAINAVLLPITIIFAEFPLYFGYSLNGIEKTTGRKVLAVAYPVFFYALQHSFIPFLIDWKHILFRFLSFLPLLLVLGIIYFKKRNLPPLMIGHGFLDLATGLQILALSIYPALFGIMNARV
ncbi:MAG: hypothetical protein JXB33_01600 [Clostridia bacterium]|nr:hypothetical protein [Clostridia bacterium]